MADDNILDTPEVFFEITRIKTINYKNTRQYIMFKC